MSQLVGITKRPQYLRSQAVAQQSLNKVCHKLYSLISIFTAFANPAYPYFFSRQLYFFRQYRKFYLNT
jgi:hypothetical protein